MKNHSWLRIIAAILVGEIALVLLTTLAQEVLFDGIRFSSSPWSVLIFGGLATFLAAVGAGRIARWVMGEDQKIVPTIITLLIIIETGYLISRQVSGDPVWFDVLAGVSLVIGIWLGFYALKRGGSRAKVY